MKYCAKRKVGSITSNWLSANESIILFTKGGDALAYICEFCGEHYDDFTAHRMRLCCCGEQLVPADQFEGDGDE